MKNPRTKLEMEQHITKLAEATSGDEQIRMQLRSADNTLVGMVRDRYFGVSDHITELVVQLTKLNRQTGEFGADLKHAKAMMKSFDKMVLGKFI